MPPKLHAAERGPKGEGLTPPRLTSLTKSSAKSPKLKIRLVDAFAIRNSSLENEEFGAYGTAVQWPKLIPAGEVWIDKNVPEKERPFMIHGAEEEYAKSKAGKTASQAYDYSLMADQARREQTNEGSRPHHDEVIPDVYIEKWKTVQGRTEPIEVWIVDEFKVRNLFKCDFTQGGHPYVYAWIPENEIWIGNQLDPAERQFVLDHEFHERDKMKNEEEDYDDAHDESSKVEFQARKEAGLTGKKFLPDLSPLSSELEESIRQAVLQTDVNPTEAQKASGQYAKGKFKWNGLTIALENPHGSVRSGKSKDGKEWAIRMAHHYGYILKIGGVQEGADGDHIDCFIGPYPSSDQVFIVNQLNDKGDFDEHKCMLGFKTIEDAKRGYLACYEPGWDRLGSIFQLSVERFKEWLKGGETDEPIGKASFKSMQTLHPEEDSYRSIEGFDNSGLPDKTPYGLTRDTNEQLATKSESAEQFEAKMALKEQAEWQQKAMSAMSETSGGALVPPPAQSKKVKPFNCTCKYPNPTLRNGSGHDFHCPVHLEWLARGGFNQHKDVARPNTSLKGPKKEVVESLLIRTKSVPKPPSMGDFDESEHPRNKEGEFAEKESRNISKSDQVLAAIEKLAASNHNLIPLHQLGRELGLAPAALHQEINRLRREWKISPSGFEGRHGITEEERRYLLPDAGGHQIGYVSLRKSMSFDQWARDFKAMKPPNIGDFDESKHPRDEEGKFSETEGGIGRAKVPKDLDYSLYEGGASGWITPKGKFVPLVNDHESDVVDLTNDEEMTTYKAVEKLGYIRTIHNSLIGEHIQHFECTAAGVPIAEKWARDHLNPNKITEIEITILPNGKVITRYPFDEKSLKLLIKSLTPPKVESYFSRCKRDDEGHCLPEGESESPSSKYPHSFAEAFDKAKETAAKFQKELARIRDPKLVEDVKSSLEFLRGLTKKFTDKVMTRYGKAGGLMVLSSGQAVGWGVFAVSTATGVPLYIPGSTILGSLPAIAVAEMLLKLKRELMSREKSLELSEEEAERIWKFIQREIKEEYEKHLAEKLSVEPDEISTKSLKPPNVGDFDESKHPRNKEGEFAEKEERTESKTPQKKKGKLKIEEAIDEWQSKPRKMGCVAATKWFTDRVHGFKPERLTRYTKQGEVFEHVVASNGVIRIDLAPYADTPDEGTSTKRLFGSKAMTSVAGQGFTGKREDSLGRDRCYQDGRLVPCQGSEINPAKEPPVDPPIPIRGQPINEEDERWLEHAFVGGDEFATKSLGYYFTKAIRSLAGQPCGLGQTAEATGCIPAKGETQYPQTAQIQQPQESLPQQLEHEKRANEYGRSFSDKKEILSWGKRGWKQWAKELTPIYKQALDTYQSGYYQDVNEMIRSGSRPDQPLSKEGVDFTNKVLRLGRALKGAVIPEDVVVYRGISDVGRLKLKEGEVFQDNGFMSTTLDREHAKSYADPEIVGGAALMEIHTPKGTNAAFVDAVGGDVGESEVLFNRGTKMEVLSIRKEGEQTIVSMRVV